MKEEKMGPKVDLDTLPYYPAASEIPEGEFPEDLMADPELPVSARQTLAQEWLNAVACHKYALEALDKMQADVKRFKSSEESIRIRLAAILVADGKKRDFILVDNQLVEVQIRAKGIPYVRIAADDVAG